MLQQNIDIILAVTEEGRYLQASVRAAIAACSACSIAADIIVVSSASNASVTQAVLSVYSNVRVLLRDTESLAQLYNWGAKSTSREAILFLREGILLQKDALSAMLDALMIDEHVGAVGPFTNRTIYSWQYINAAYMEEVEGKTLSFWLRKHLTGAAEGLFLENFALLVRRSIFMQTGCFSEDFSGTGGEDIDLSFRLRCAGYHLLRAPVYLPHEGADIYDLFVTEKTTARPVLLEHWGLDIGIPEKLWTDALMAIDWKQGHSLIRATCRSALLSAPLVSIMIPTYNRPAFFKETLESARAQIYPNIEIIICDNGTDDRTEALMQNYRDDMRVRYVRNLSAKTKAENFMPFEHLARGEFLQWCMDDDILLPDKLTVMVDAFFQHPKVTLVTSQRGTIDGRGNFLGMRDHLPFLYGNHRILDGNKVGKVVLMDQMNFLGEPSAVLFRRRDLTHHYWRAESRGYTVISDCAMWLELLERGDCMIFSRPLSLYRRHAAQEGQNIDVVIRSRIEWRRLMGEYWRRHLFLEKEEDYQMGISHLEEECKEFIEPLLPQASPDVRREYQTGIAALPIVVMCRSEEPIANMRVMFPLFRCMQRGAVTLSGCVKEGDAQLEIYDVTHMWETLILFQRARFPATLQNVRMFAQSGAQGNIILHEVDDHPSRWPEIAASNHFVYRAASAVQTSTQTLADFFREFNPYILLFENQLETLPEQRNYDLANERVHIFFGAFNRQEDWTTLMPAINEAIQTYGDRLYFRVASDHAFYEALQTSQKWFAGGTKDGDVIAPYEVYTAALHASDIALLPLNDNIFNRAKSDLKFIEAAGHGAAVLASPVVYGKKVCDGETGLIYQSTRDFSEKLANLIERPELRVRLAENAYRYVKEHRLLDQHLDDYIAAYRELFERWEELERERLRRVEKFFPHL